ncbi:hypothetical protein [Marmoricola sp. RAF53]|uniref:hypothetical protein n=1 Tax=Marmoricola sp. RAF53 TaxID=3233059 RepID=UPI003F9AADEE
MRSAQRSALRLVAALAGLAAVTSGCSGGSGGGIGGFGGTTQVEGKNGAEVALEAGTCWTGDLLGADPQRVLRLSTDLGVTYFAAARALADRPAFSRTQSCDKAHDLEVYRAVQVPALAPSITSYADLMRTDQPLYQQLDRAVTNACMAEPLATTAALSKVAGATAQPALPETMELGWAPPSPDQFARGQRVFACTLRHRKASTVRYDEVLTRKFPTALRTCIDSKSLVYVDCARKHDRERIAVIEARTAVLAGRFPGRKAIRSGLDGRFLDVSPAAYAALDKACTRYLRTISTVKKLTGVAEIDVDAWPTADGSYPILCEADTRPDKKPVVTQGSVYNR